MVSLNNCYNIIFSNYSHLELITFFFIWIFSILIFFFLEITVIGVNFFNTKFNYYNKKSKKLQNFLAIIKLFKSKSIKKNFLVFITMYSI